MYDVVKCIFMLLQIEKLIFFTSSGMLHFTQPNRYNSIEIFGGATAKKKRGLGHLDHTHNYTQTHTKARAHCKTSLNEQSAQLLKVFI